MCRTEQRKYFKTVKAVSDHQLEILTATDMMDLVLADRTRVFSDYDDCEPEK
jgi:hypothetical protein